MSKTAGADQTALQSETLSTNENQKMTLHYAGSHFGHSSYGSFHRSVADLRPSIRSVVYEAEDKLDHAKKKALFERIVKVATDISDIIEFVTPIIADIEKYKYQSYLDVISGSLCSLLRKTILDTNIDPSVRLRMVEEIRTFCGECMQKTMPTDVDMEDSTPSIISDLLY